MRPALVPIRALIIVAILSASVVPTPAQIIEVPTFTAVAADHEFIYGLDVAAGADSSMLFGWNANPDRSEKRFMMARRFSSTGVGLGTALQVDTDDEAGFANVVSDTRGGFIAAWRRFGPSSVDFEARLLGSDGAPSGPVFQVFEESGYPYHAEAGLPSGLVFVRPEQSRVRARLFDSVGVPRGSSFVVREHDVFGSFQPRVVATGDGGFVIGWPESEDAWIRVYDATGAPVGAAVRIASEFELHDLAASPLGGFVVVGARRTDTHALPSGVWARRFDAGGTPTGPSFVVAAIDPDVNAQARAAFDPAGRLYVAWGLSGSVGGLLPHARVYDSAGAPLTASFRIGDEFAGLLALAARPDGRFVTGWSFQRDLHANVVALCVPPEHTSCGDGLVQSPCERCDQGSANSDSTPGACRTTCYPASCGDGIVDPGEECDDGNGRGCDGCDAACHLEVGYVCGDGVLNTDCEEQCDDGSANSDTTPDACRTSCRLAGCADGVLDSTDGCDDGNRTSCDGCSDVCVPEPGLVCGDGIPELHCGEQCDDGNAIVGDGCTEPCRLERIPGGGSPRADCKIEWSIDNPANVPRYDKKGAISGVQTCVDGDPRCDFDGVAGRCTFHLEVCANNTDGGAVGCSVGPRLSSWELRSPSAAKAASRPELAAVRDAFTSVPGAIVGPTTTDLCSNTLEVPIALRQSGTGAKAGKLTIKSLATLYSGEKDNDKLQLICIPGS